MWNIKYDINKHVYETETDLQIKRTDLWLPSGREGLEFGISRCKLLYMGWINNKVLLFSTGNCTQYPAVNHKRKECEKDCVHV